MRQQKRDILLKEIENRRKLAKTKHARNKHIFEEKTAMISRREKQGDTQKKKEKKRRIIKDSTQEMKDK